jgi:hypothetical protein
MTTRKQKNLLAPEMIERRILLLRGKKVMLDRDLAFLYGVETKALNQAVKRNCKRFPQDFMFQLTKSEFEDWKSQFVTSNSERRGLRKTPFAFTEQGVAMLSSVLKSDKAIEVNIQIMRTFTKLRELMLTHKDLHQRIDALEKKYDKKFRNIFEVIKQLIELPPPEPKLPIGFHARP